ncbi:MAG: methylmalonyl Co-A mutase-associated GTPase MeaB [Gemmatimonadaceae bacterium]
MSPTAPRPELTPAQHKLLDDFFAGRAAALARVVSIVENRRAGFEAVLAALHPRLGRAWRVGLTGPPGAGKSTLTNRLTQEYRAAGRTVGIIAVDPTSPFTGGALLGDRIRMEAVALDPGVFIRSMATRGSLGGLAAATREVADVYDAFGINVILIETVGVGQSELDIARTADSSIVVLVPESGDSIQTLKAGLMEIADLYVVNKADRPGADRLRNELELMLGLRAGNSMRDMPAHHGVDLKRVMTPEERRAQNPARVARALARDEEAATWTPPVLATVGVEGKGVTEVIDAVERHRRYLERSGELRVRRARRLRERVIEVAERLVRARLWGDEATQATLEDSLPALERGETTPFAVAASLLASAAPVVGGSTRR